MRQSLVWNKQRLSVFDSSDDDEWEVPIDPLVNIITFGSTEDGRCGYEADNDTRIQTAPKPIPSLRAKPIKKRKGGYDKYICRTAAAGSRHSLLLMMNVEPSIRVVKSYDNGKDSDSENDEGKVYHKRYKKKLMLTGLNQLALCEEKGYPTPTDLAWDYDYDPPVTVAAGRGTSFFTTRLGFMFSFGHGRYGVLGHGHANSIVMPQQIVSLDRKKVVKISTGSFHTIIMTSEKEVIGWGRNHKGQLGRGFESHSELHPDLVNFQHIRGCKVIDVSCGEDHCIASVSVTKTVKEGTEDVILLFAWGDDSRGQLGSCDPESRSKPMENRWLTRYLRINQFTVSQIAAGGYHNLVLTRPAGQVISWGGGDYGQLGNGLQWDEPSPRMINNLKDVVLISAGLRHSVAVKESQPSGVYCWGYNAYGQLGLGDTNIRLQPTLMSALKNTRVLEVSCGDRHTVLVTSYRPLTAREDPSLMPYFKIIKNSENNPLVVKRLKRGMEKVGLDPSYIDNPSAILPDQAGSADGTLHNDKFEKGLRYCLDTMSDPFDWRRKALEACFECHTKTQHLKSVCLSCARNCLFAYRLRPIIKKREKGDTCDCRTSGLCVCAWTPIREAFDRVMSDGDGCIGPKQVRGLLKSLRAPYPVEGIDVLDCLLAVAEGKEDDDQPRIRPAAFEEWYRHYFDEKIVEEVSEKNPK